MGDKIYASNFTGWFVAGHLFDQVQNKISKLRIISLPRAVQRIRFTYADEATTFGYILFMGKISIYTGLCP